MNNTITLSQTVRHCSDIGLMSIDLPCTSCKHASKYCKANCYNLKLYKLYPNMSKKDIANASAWDTMTEDTANALAKKVHRNAKSSQDRFRLMTRGEALATQADFEKVSIICKAMGKTLVWLPTRAWRKASFFEDIIALKMKHKNLRLLLSIDPSNSGNTSDRELLAKYLELGFSTMFFGDNEALAQGLPVSGQVLQFKACPKTWDKAHGHCRDCRGGCFSPSQVHIHLKKH